MLRIDGHGVQHHVCGQSDRQSSASKIRTEGKGLIVYCQDFPNDLIESIPGVIDEPGNHHPLLHRSQACGQILLVLRGQGLHLHYSGDLQQKGTSRRVTEYFVIPFLSTVTDGDAQEAENSD